MKKVLRWGLAAIVVIAAAGVAIALLFYNGIWHVNTPSRTTYPLRGVDVSSYQGTIDWEVLSQQDIAFAFIKATEGSSFADECFSENWTNATNTDLYTGAYHFFSFESSGKSQAAHYIDTVGELDATRLPPVIDVEYYDVPAGVDTSPATVRKELGEMIDVLTARYQRSPILYVTDKTYTDFVKGWFPVCPLWVRSVYGKPDYIDADGWSFWQYSNRHRLAGYEGKEPYIDMNVYNGDRKAFADQFSLR